MTGFKEDLDGRPPVKNIPEPIRAQDDIGPIYKMLGFVALFFSLGIVAVQAIRGVRIGGHDIIFVLITALVCVCLIRPNNFDRAIKVLADRLPMFKYSSDG